MAGAGGYLEHCRLVGTTRASPRVTTSILAGRCFWLPRQCFVKRSVLHTACAMDVAVLDLFLTGFAHRGDFNIEIQCLSRQWVVTIDGDRVTSDLSDGDQ